MLEPALTWYPRPRCGRWFGQPTLVSVTLHSSVKQTQLMPSLVRVPKCHNLFVDERSEHTRFDKSREKLATIGRLVGNKCSFVEILKLFSVFCPLFMALLWHDDEVLVIWKLFNKVASEDVSNDSGKVSLGSICSIVPFSSLVLFLVIEVIRPLVQWCRGREGGLDTRSVGGNDGAMSGTCIH